MLCLFLCDFLDFLNQDSLVLLNASLLREPFFEHAPRKFEQDAQEEFGHRSHLLRIPRARRAPSLDEAEAVSRLPT